MTTFTEGQRVTWNWRPNPKQPDNIVKIAGVYDKPWKKRAIITVPVQHVGGVWIRITRVVHPARLEPRTEPCWQLGE
jgi:hypothetical protein